MRIYENTKARNFVYIKGAFYDVKKIQSESDYAAKNINRRGI